MTRSEREEQLEAADGETGVAPSPPQRLQEHVVAHRRVVRHDERNARPVAQQLVPEVENERQGFDGRPHAECRCVREPVPGLVCVTGNLVAFLNGPPQNYVRVLGRLVVKLGRIPGIDRPAIATVFPSLSAAGRVVLLDAGANPDCAPQNLLQFAVMGSIYAEEVLAAID